MKHEKIYAQQVDISLSPCNHNKHCGPSQVIPRFEFRVWERIHIYNHLGSHKHSSQHHTVKICRLTVT